MWDYVTSIKTIRILSKKYGTCFFGLNKMYLLMEKQHNRGQDGVGLANIKLDVEFGKRYISRKASYLQILYKMFLDKLVEDLLSWRIKILKN